MNALVAATHALVSAEGEYFSLQGVEQVLEVMELARDNLNEGLEWLGVVLNMADMRMVHTRETLDSTARELRRQGVPDRDPQVGALPGVGRARRVDPRLPAGARRRLHRASPTSCSRGSATRRRAPRSGLRRAAGAGRGGTGRAGGPLAAPGGVARVAVEWSAMAVTERTPEVLNQPPPLEDYNAFEADLALQEALVREGGEWGVDRARDFGADGRLGRGARALATRAAQHPAPGHARPLRNRIDAIDYDPSFHWMLRLAVEREVSALAWREPRPGAHVVRAALFHMFNGLDTGPACPMAINYAAVPTMRHDAELAAEWEERIAPRPTTTRTPGGDGDDREAGRLRPARQHARSPIPSAAGSTRSPGTSGSARTRCSLSSSRSRNAPGGLTCFVAERPHPGFRLQRLKDKLGGRCLASTEVEFRDLPARIIGEEGRGIAVMATQINYTRLDTHDRLRRDAAAHGRGGLPPHAPPLRFRRSCSPSSR